MEPLKIRLIDLLPGVFYGRYHCKLCLGIMFLKINSKIIVFEQLLKGVVSRCGSTITKTFWFSDEFSLFGIHPKRVNLSEVFSNLLKVAMALRGCSNLETHIPEFTCWLRLRSFQLTVSINFASFSAAKMA